MTWLDQQLQHSRMPLQEWGLERWIREVPQTTLVGLENGHAPQAVVPGCIMHEGPLRQALIAELSFKTICERMATEGLAQLLQIAPDNASFEYLTTQIFDEARHASIFRNHLVEIGAADDSAVDSFIQLANVKAVREILQPLSEYFTRHVVEHKRFINGVVIITIILEGVLAPSSELSELKWRVFDPAAAQIQHGANVDEVRHLLVCSEIVRALLIKQPGLLDEVNECLDEGMQIWSQVPIQELVLRRENLYQEGMQQHSWLADSVYIDETPLVQTTPESRMQTAERWSEQMQASRLRFMGLDSGEAGYEFAN